MWPNSSRSVHCIITLDGCQTWPGNASGLRSGACVTSQAPCQSDIERTQRSPTFVTAVSAIIGACGTVGLLHFAFIALLMIYGSMRFDDAKHVTPHSVTETKDGLVMIARHTKTERERGTKIHVPNMSLSGAPWHTVGLAMWRQCSSSDAWHEVDFLACKTDRDGLRVTQAASCTSFAADLKATCRQALSLYPCKDFGTSNVENLTPHSLR
eukprot:5705739-Amphidinium_carterae.1